MADTLKRLTEENKKLREALVEAYEFLHSEYYSPFNEETHGEIFGEAQDIVNLISPLIALQSEEDNG